MAQDDESLDRIEAALERTGRRVEQPAHGPGYDQDQRLRV